MSAIIKTLGVLLTCFSGTMIPPLLIAIGYHDSSALSFYIAFFTTLLIGLLCWRPFIGNKRSLRTRDGFLVVALFWVALSLFAALPLYFNLATQLSWTDALFESVSGLTTTGATIFDHLGSLSHSVLYYRQQLHLLGGIGIVVLAVAVLPMLGVGGMQLYQAEIAGPLKRAKLTPRITQTAKALWSIYAVLIIACAIAYYAAGMSIFDAICESFSTVSTGGFSTHDASFGFYHSTSIELIAVIFMCLGAINFSLHFQCLREGRWSVYWQDAECKTYLKLIFVLTLGIGSLLLLTQHYHGIQNYIHALFTVTSISTTTGLNIDNISLWPSFLPYLLIFLSILGGCAGSTSGGIKIIRAMLIRQQAKRECLRLIHPRSVQAITFGDHVLPPSIVETMWGFLVLFVVVFIALLLTLLATHMDFSTAFSALVACISNTGAGIGKVASHYKDLHEASKWVLIVAMLAGRLEIFTLIVICMPAYYRY